MRIVVRKMEAPDVGKTKELIQEYVDWTNLDLRFQNIDDEMAHFPRKYEEPEGAFFVAVDDDRVIGCVGLKKIGEKVCEMKRLFVKDEYKGLGVGKRLIETAIEEARVKKYEKMRLDTLKRMDRALELYKRYGFNEIRQYVENPMEDAVFLEKDLSVYQ